MKRPNWIQISDRAVSFGLDAGDPIHLAIDEGSAHISAAELAERIVVFLSRQETALGWMVLIIPSSWCLVHRFSVPQRRPTRAMLTYAFEEYLPCDVETLTCEFLRGDRGEYIGVGVETARVAPIIEAIATTGVEVDRITLDVLEAARAHAAARTVWCDEEHVAVVRHDAFGRCRELRILRFAARPPNSWAEHVAALVGPLIDNGTDAPETTHLTGCVVPERLQRLAGHLGKASTTTLLNPRSAYRAVTGELDLARDGLQPSANSSGLFKLVQRSLATLLVACLLLAAGLLLQRRALHARLDDVTAWERQIFAHVFPGQDIPAGVALRVASERRRLESLTLADGEASVERPDALRTLHGLVGAIPADLRIDLQEVRIDGPSTTLRGRTTDHAGAERLAAAIDALESLDCAAPRTDRSPAGGVQFFLNAFATPEISKSKRDRRNPQKQQTAQAAHSTLERARTPESVRQTAWTPNHTSPPRRGETP